MPAALFATLAVVFQAPSVNICIDPGHPSEISRGTRGRQVTEIQVAWRVAKALEAKLTARGFRVVLTKSKEQEFVTNRRRAEIANAAHAALMLRLHCDAGSGSGFAVYYPDRTGTSHGVTGPKPEILRSSALAGRRFHAAMAKSMGSSLKDDGLRTDRQTAVGSRLGALTGSIFSRVPVVLVEMAVLTNRRDEAFIVSRAGQAKIAQALCDGVSAAVGADKK